jgi:hypothetical protein
MSSDTDKIKQLIQKVDAITLEMNKISEELRFISATLKSLAASQISQPTFQASSSMSSPIAVNPTETPRTRTVDDIRLSFPEELETRLGFEEKGEFIIIKPKMFLGSENFAKIASAVRGMGGEYISAGKESHFRVPKKKT